MRSSLTYISWSADTVLSSLNSGRKVSKHLCKNWYIELPEIEQVYEISNTSFMQLMPALKLKDI